MPPLKNPRWEKFARLMAEGGQTATEAYKLAGFRPSRFNASKLANTTIVKERIILLANKVADNAAFTQQINAEVLVKMHRKLHDHAVERGQISAGVAAVKEMSILTGHRVERAEIGTPGEYDHLADADLERVLIERIAELGLADGDDDVGEAGLARMLTDDDTQH